jgi:hypothetical protein
MKCITALLLSVMAIFAFSCNKENPDLWEYNALLDDLIHVDIPGYKTHFDDIDHKGKLNLPRRNYQGWLLFTDISHHFAITGTGFFRILIDDAIIGYTRNGLFMLSTDDAGNYRLIPPLSLTGEKRYTLADPIDVYMYNGELDGTMTAKQLKVYDVPYEQLRHRGDGVYIVDPDFTDEIKTSETSRVNAKCLETSNVPVIAVITRMYFIALHNDKIKNVAFKRELLSLALSHYAANNDEMVKGYMADLYGILQKPDTKEPSFDAHNKMNTIYEGNRHVFIQSILPFLHLDY